MGPVGIAILALIFVVFGPLSGNTPGENASGATVVSYWSTSTHQDLGWLSIYMVGLALALLLVWATQLRTILRDAEGRPSFLPNTAFAGGIIFVAGTVVTGIDHMVLIVAAHNHQASIAQSANFIDQNNYLPFLFGLSLLTLATGACILNRSSLPKWLGWVSVIIGVLCVAGPLSFFGLIASGVWLAVAGFVVGYHRPATAGGAVGAPQTLGAGQTVSTS